MMDPAPNTPGTPTAGDARLELTVAAAAAERANRPRWIIVLGGALLLVAIIYALTEYSARASMFGKIDGERNQTKRVLDLKDSIETETLALARKGTSPNPRVGQSIEGYALSSGVTLAGAVTDTTRSGGSVPGMQQHAYTAKAINQDPQAILALLNTIQAQYEATGLEITKLRLNPGAAVPGTQNPGWNMDLELARWEKTK